MEDLFRIIILTFTLIIILAVLAYGIMVTMKRLFGIDLIRLFASGNVKYLIIAITCLIIGFILGYGTAQRSKRKQKPIHTIRL